ncbi:MAG: hypothetical protein R2809_07570 [Flavobacteriales bacterium]
MSIDFHLYEIVTGTVVLLKIIIHMYFDSVDSKVAKGIDTRGSAGIGGRYLFPIPYSKEEKRNRLIKTTNLIYGYSITIYVVAIIFRAWYNS